MVRLSLLIWMLLIIFYPQWAISAEQNNQSELTEADMNQALQDAKVLYEYASRSNAAGNKTEAILYLKQSLEIAQKALGKEHYGIDAIINQLATLYYITGQYADAEPLYKRSLEIRKKVMGEVVFLNNLADVYKARGKLAEAELIEKQALNKRDMALRNLVETLNELALLYTIQKRYSDSETLYKQSLEICEKNMGKDHPYVASSLQSLAEYYHIQGRFEDSEALYKQSLIIREKALGKVHRDVASSLKCLAELYKDQGKYGNAESLYKRALEIYEKDLEKNHPDVSDCLNNLAILYRIQGRYSEAELLYKRTLDIREKILGKDHPDMAKSLNDLAVLYRTQGRYSEAEPLYIKSLKIREKIPLSERTLNDRNGEAMSLGNLATLYRLQGRYADAEPLIKRQLEIYEKTNRMDHIDGARAFNNIAELFYAQGRYSDAEFYYKRSLEIREKCLGIEHHDVAVALNNIANLYRFLSRYAEAEKLLIQSLKIDENALGKNHPEVARPLNNLAELYQEQGRYFDAELLYNRSLEILEKHLGKDHTDIVKPLTNLASLKALMGKHSESTRLFNRAMQVEIKTMEDMFLVMSERQKLAYLDQVRWVMHSYISHTAQFLMLDISAVRETFNVWLRWKGTVMEAQGRYLDALYLSKDPLVQKKFKELTNTQRTLASLKNSKPEKISFEEYRNRITELEKTKEAIDAELSKLSKDFALEKQTGPATAANISKILPRDSVYIDYARIQPFDFKKREIGNPRYIAFVLFTRDTPDVKLIDLGETEKIDKQVSVYLHAIEDFGKYVDKLGEVDSPKLHDIVSRQEEAARAIYDLVIKPLPSLKGVKQFYLSPDGNLNLIPFEVLATPEGIPLIDGPPITYVGAGRDIMRFNDTAVAQGVALLMADPDYDLGIEEAERQAMAFGIKASSLRGGFARDAGDLEFVRLPESKTEADEIEKIIRNNYQLTVKNYQDKRALEEVLHATESPRFLHLSTHGYFLKDEQVKQRSIAMWGSLKKELITDLGIENPMLRSGLALAGANTSVRNQSDEGLMSAEEILGLKLKGTELVVLSACETGVGDVQSGEGVFGLKRSFILSGAKTVVVSLWKIPSKETEALMCEFYTQMAGGKSKVEALKEARLAIKREHPSPFYWGALLMVGNPK